MQSATNSVSNSVRKPIFGDEKIGVSCIRIRKAGSNYMMVLRSIWCADKCVQSWLDADRAACNCDFEITFEDGFVLTGRYGVGRAARRKSALISHIRKFCGRLSPQGKARDDEAEVDADATGFLELYDIDS